MGHIFKYQEQIGQNKINQKLKLSLKLDYNNSRKCDN